MGRRNVYEKDYYRILGLKEEASDEEIKKAYRRLALQCHPDRNPGDKEAEERFKEISEAYGVLIDKEKRRQYDRFRHMGFEGAELGFRYSQEDIFRDLFKNPYARDIFEELSREFHRFGFQFDQAFFNRVFFGGRGFIFGGVFIAGPFGGRRFWFSRTPADAFKKPSRERRVFEQEEKAGLMKPGLTGGFLQWVGNKVWNYLLKKISGKAKGPDLHYDLSITREEAAFGARKTFSFKREGKTETILVKIPAGVMAGTKLRLQGKGLAGKDGGPDGDLYLTIRVQD